MPRHIIVSVSATVDCCVDVPNYAAVEITPKLLCNLLTAKQVLLHAEKLRTDTFMPLYLELLDPGFAAYFRKLPEKLEGTFQSGMPVTLTKTDVRRISEQHDELLVNCARMHVMQDGIRFTCVAGCIEFCSDGIYYSRYDELKELEIQQ